jgi:hypothetical protein
VVEIVEYRWRSLPGRLQKAFGIAGVKLHAHSEVIPIGAAVDGIYTVPLPSCSQATLQFRRRRVPLQVVQRRVGRSR